VEQHQKNMVVLLAAKLVILFSLLAASLAAAVVPIILARAKVIHKCISMDKIMMILDLCQGFGGGVLLGGGILHLMAESAEHIAETLKEMNVSERVQEYPWSPLLAVIALGIIFFVEMILTSVVKAFQDRNRTPKAYETPNGEKSTLMNANEPVVRYNDECTDVENPEDLKMDKTHEYDEHTHDSRTHGHGHGHGDIEFTDIEKTSSSAGKLITAVVLWLSLTTHVSIKKMKLTFCSLYLLDLV
jgi:hypothetical protein